MSSMYTGVTPLSQVELYSQMTRKFAMLFRSRALSAVDHATVVLKVSVCPRDLEGMPPFVLATRGDAVIVSVARLQTQTTV